MSPCTKICKYDPTGTYCVGCFRTPSEITMWSSMDEEQQSWVVAMTEVRKVANKVDSKGWVDES